jgi:hypothetical protein
MEKVIKLTESLIEKTYEYGMTSFELAKLKAVDKTSDLVSSVIPHSIILLTFSIFLLFLNLGIAFWAGELLGKIFYGFLAVAGFYCFIGILIRLFLFKRIKEGVRNYIINQVLN